MVRDVDFPWAMHRGIRQEIESWGEIYCEPGGDSYYSMPGKNWDSPPVGLKRASDHWDFLHKQTGVLSFQTGENLLFAYWAVAEWDGYIYRVLKKEKRLRLIDLTDDEAMMLNDQQRFQRNLNLQTLAAPHHELPEGYVDAVSHDEELFRSQPKST